MEHAQTKAGASPGYECREIPNGIEIVACRGLLILRFTRKGDTITVTEHRADGVSRTCGSLIRLLGGQWLADQTLKSELVHAARPTFRERWGDYWVIGSDGHHTVSSSTYESLLALHKRLRRAKLLETKSDGRFLFALEDEDTFLEVDSTAKPYRERILRTEGELEDRGWSPSWCGESPRMNTRCCDATGHFVPNATAEFPRVQ